MQFGRK